MKNMIKRTIAILAVMTVVFTAAATTCCASYDENAENGIMPIWEHEVENSNRD